MSLGLMAPPDLGLVPLPGLSSLGQWDLPLGPSPLLSRCLMSSVSVWGGQAWDLPFGFSCA